MAGNNIPEEAVEQELDAPRFRIPNEVWTDVFKVQPRSILVKLISPVCYRFKEICNKNVKNIHVITIENKFTYKLKWDDPEANQQLEQLTANKCQLAGQFKLAFFRICEKSENKVIILRHSLDLLQGCQIRISPSDKWENEKLAFIKECLGILEPCKPIMIRIDQCEDLIPDSFWPNPTVQKCSRVVFNIWMKLSDTTMVIAFENIFDWLHHQPKGGVDCKNATDQQVRGMIACIYGHEHIDLLINRCSLDIQQGREPIDRRPFVLSFFRGPDWAGFGQFRRIENKFTGEVLVLDRVMEENDEPSGQYRLRRCLAVDEASGPEFYAGMFKGNYGVEEFNFDANKTSKVIIR